MKVKPVAKVHTVDDGFGSMWDCTHLLSSEFCCMEVVRPGKVQCVCDAGLESLLKHTYERGESAGGYEALRDADERS